MLKELHSLTSDESMAFEDKVGALLRLGLAHFGLEHAIVSHIQNDAYTIEHVESPNAELRKGMVLALGDTYCLHTLKAGEAMAVSHTAQSDIAHHPCYLQFQLESYIGMKVVVNGALYGTLNFSSAIPREQPFSADDIDFIHLFAQWIGVEISRRQERQEMARRLELQGQMEQLADIGCWEVDLVNNRLYWSEQTKRIHDVPAGYVPELQSAIDFYHAGEDRDRITLLVERAITFGEPWSTEVRLKTYTGKIKWVATQGRAEFIDGQCTRIFGAFQDIDAQVNTRNALIEKKNEAQRLLKARSTMIGKISHELRTPINGITGMLQTLVGESNQDIIESRVAIALRSADLLVRLVNDVLDYSKVQNGELELETVRFAPKHIFDDLQALYAPQVKNKQVELDFRINLPPTQYCIGDPGRLTQIFSNLLNNALKFTEHGGIKLTAKLKQKNGITDLVVSIIDSGIGMPATVLDRLFVPFKQGSAAITAKYGGSGLGLAIVKELCDKLGGTVSVKSAEGVGTQVCVRLPLSLVDDSRTSAEIDYIGPENVSFKNIKILVVDDNEINRLVMESLLSQVQVTADYVVNGEEAVNAVKKAKAAPYNLIFMDCEMPVMGGVEATLAIRQNFKNTGKIFIVAMTADTSDANRKACLKAGMDTFLTKPIKLEDITTVLGKIAFPAMASF
ncbi:hybrid sensor histidine kinase/response regulator [Salinimonas sediminis]|uniref:histidine kinase n=1 Tax=Salinimonas sediminis TaxID=2303538 RepID=A0A346NPD4_9ALTE|nr:ATP-binding protein [Salinimonas sediminis]AXR07391.1 response regulator [Salinimonas sediminis]